MLSFEVGVSWVVFTWHFFFFVAIKVNYWILGIFFIYATMHKIVKSDLKQKLRL